jgi:tetratricopeptide (TPR) repeat protein
VPLTQDPLRTFYAGYVAGSTGRRWIAFPQWTDEVVNWVERRAERSVESPEDRLELAERRLAKSLQKQGPESWRSINAMEAVANSRVRVGRYSEALPLRRQVVDGRRKHLGTDHRLTLAAEARLAVTLIELQRPDKAKPLLVHVLRGLTATHGPDDLTTLAVTERLADAELALGQSTEARRLLEQVMIHYEERGDEVLASGIATKLAKSLIRDGQYPAASELLRNVVDARSRTLGPDDPETLASLRNLASSLVWTREFAEASIVARNLLATTLRTLGPEHEDTLKAAQLLENIDRWIDAD